MAAQYSMGLTVRDQLTKTELATVNNRAGSRVEAYNVGDDVVCFTGLFFGKVSLGIFWVREAGGCFTRSWMGIVGQHTALAAATNPCCIAGGTSIIGPVTSPAPKIIPRE
jgi:hypothetical protein